MKDVFHTASKSQLPARLGAIRMLFLAGMLESVLI